MFRRTSQSPKREFDNDNMHEELTKLKREGTRRGEMRRNDAMQAAMREASGKAGEGQDKRRPGKMREGSERWRRALWRWTAQSRGPGQARFRRRTLKKRSTCTRQMDPSKSPQDSSGHRMAHREVTELTEVGGASGAWWSPPTIHHLPSLGKVAAPATRTSSCGAFLAAPRPCALSCQSVTELTALGGRESVHFLCRSSTANR